MPRVTCAKCRQSFDVVASPEPTPRGFRISVISESFDRSRCFEPQSSDDDIVNFDCSALHEALWEAFATRH